MKTYEEVAKHHNLTGKRADLFVEYMKTRWFDLEELYCQCGYASEWADRFAKGVEFQTSDDIGRQILKELYARIL